MRYHWGLGVGHLYSHGHKDQPIASGNLSREDSTVAVRPELSDLDHLDHSGSESDHLIDSESLSSHRDFIPSHSEPEPDLVEQVEQTLAEEKLDSDIEDGWNSDLNQFSAYDLEQSVDNHDSDSDSENVMELFDHMFGGTQEMEFTSYD